MKQKSKEGEQLNLFDRFDKIALSPEGHGVAMSEKEKREDFLSALREQRDSTTKLLNQILDYGNVKRAIKAVKSNDGSPGIDHRSIEETEGWLSKNFISWREEILKGKYRVSGVKQVEIPKLDGGIRILGIPTVQDRILQQAIHQHLNHLYDRYFSESSYGFRPGRNAHQAITQANQYIQEGNEWVVDIDLEKYFDTIPHDRLMQRLSKGIGDKVLLRLIRQCLEAGMMKEGLVSQRTSGSPQGGPLSPLLSNIVLDELDRELEKRGHKFCRYADDCNIFVKSKKAGERVMASMIKYIEEELKLKVNRQKSGVRKCSEVKFLGYTIMEQGKIRVADKTIERLKKKVIEATKRNKGESFKMVINKLNLMIQGFGVYYRLANSWLNNFNSIDGWMRRRLRCYRLKQCDNKYTIVKFLRSLHVPEQECWNVAHWSNQKWWPMSINPIVSKAMGMNWFAEHGLRSFKVTIERY